MVLQYFTDTAIRAARCNSFIGKSLGVSDVLSYEVTQ
jgi:hypothetical protein